jgi:hypothetical protein
MGRLVPEKRDAAQQKYRGSDVESDHHCLSTWQNGKRGTNAGEQQSEEKDEARRCEAIADGPRGCLGMER